MTDLSPIRFGENAQLAAPQFDDLWLPIFGGEVLTRFEENNLMLPLVNMKPITTGTTLRFPRLWLASAERHAAGAELLGLDTEQGEIEISLDARPIVSHHVLDDIDLMMSHFEIRSDLATEAARALAREVDSNVIRLLLNTSRTAQPANGPFLGGGVDGNGLAIVDATLAATDVPSSTASRDAAGALLAAIDRAVITFEADDRNVPFENRVCVTNVNLWYALKQFGIPISDAEMFAGGRTAGPFWSGNLGISGPSGNVNPPRDSTLMYNGVSIWKSPRMGAENVTTGPAKYQGDFSNSVGVIFHREAMAYIMKIGNKVERERSVRHGADFLVVKHLGGGGALRPDFAIELVTA